MNLKFTGHPLPDVGIATLCAMSGKSMPEELTAEDLDQCAQELEENYFSGRMNSYLSCVFMNSEYVQPDARKEEGKERKALKRKQYAQRVLRAHRWEGDVGTGDLKCAYTGLPATHLVHRSQVPMLTGEDVINFFPAGRGTLPIAGPYLLAIQALPMGGRRAEGRMLLVHSDDGSLMTALAAKYVADNRRLLDLARKGQLPARDGPDPLLEREHAAKDGNEPKYPDAKAPTSLVASDLMDVCARRNVDGQSYASVAVYVLSNSGQGPSLQVHFIPSQVVRFLALVQRSGAARYWQQLVARSWLEPSKKKEQGSEGQPRSKPSSSRKKVSTPAIAGGAGRSRNSVLQDLFAVFEGDFVDRRGAAGFVRRHLFPNIRFNQVPSDRAARGDELTLVNWELTELFLSEVLGMERTHIEKIREFADRLAEHIAASNDRSLFRDLVYSQKPWEVRNALVKAQRNEAKDHRKLLFGLDDFVDVFMADDSIGVADWGMIRDLISIRLIEALHARDFFEQRADWLTAPDAGEEQAA